MENGEGNKASKSALHQGSGGKQTKTPKTPKGAARFAEFKDEPLEEQSKRQDQTVVDKQKITQNASEVKKRRSTVQPKHHDAKITMKDFTDWKESCGIFRVQRQYELIAADARDEGISIAEHMRDQGFKDYNHFARSCQRFALWCWTGDFSELGSGFVLYFHFLAFLSFLMFLLQMLQIPALVYYASVDNVGNWDQDAPRNYFISDIWLTPGNLGPDAGDSFAVIFCYMSFVPILCLSLVGQAQHQKMTEAWVDEDFTSPNDFAILVKGLPSTVTDEAAIMNFFEQHAISGKSTAEIVKVVIGWTADGLFGRIQKIAKYQQLLRKVDADSKDAETIVKELESIGKELEQAADGQTLKSSGTVIVSFRYQEDHRACLARWNTKWGRWFNSEARDVMFLPKGNGLGRGEPLPRFPANQADQPACAVQVYRAPLPGDINWMKLGVTSGRRLRKKALTNFIMAALIFGSFWSTFGVEMLKQHIRDKGKNQSGDNYWLLLVLSILPGGGVVLVNHLLSFVAREFGQRESHDTFTEQESSISLKVGVAMFINTSGVMVWLHWDSKEWYAKGGLAEDVVWVMIADGVLAHFLGLIDMGYSLKWCARRKVTEKQLQSWTETIRKNTSGETLTKEGAEELNTVREEVFEAKRAFEPSETDMSERFASAVNSFLFCIIFTPVVPILPAIALLGFVIQYWMDKVLLLRWQKRPTPQNSALAVGSLNVINGSAICFVVSVYWYLMPSWNAGDSSTLYFFCFLSASIFVTIFPLRVWALIICCPCCVFERKRKRFVDESFQDYYKAQAMWSPEMKYHKDQYLYKSLPIEKNPEMLDPDVKPKDRALHVDVYKGAFQGVVAHAARSVGQPVQHAVPINEGWSHCHWHAGHGARQHFGGHVPIHWNTPILWNTNGKATFGHWDWGYRLPTAHSVPASAVTPTWNGAQTGYMAQHPPGNPYGHGQVIIPPTQGGYAAVVAQPMGYGSNPAAYGGTWGTAMNSSGQPFPHPSPASYGAHTGAYATGYMAAPAGPPYVAPHGGVKSPTGSAYSWPARETE